MIWLCAGLILVSIWADAYDRPKTSVITLIGSFLALGIQFLTLGTTT